MRQLSLASFTVELYQALPDPYEDDYSGVLAFVVEKLNTACSGTDNIRIIIQHFAEYYYDPAVAHWDRVSMMWKTRPRRLAD